MKLTYNCVVYLSRNACPIFQVSDNPQIGTAYNKVVDCCDAQIAAFWHLQFLQFWQIIFGKNLFNAGITEVGAKPEYKVDNIEGGPNQFDDEVCNKSW